MSAENHHNGVKNLSDFADPGSAIAAAIEARKCDQQRFAKLIGISPPLLSMLLTNKRRPSDTVIPHLSEITGWSELEWK
ncbi:MAG: helix-turn-helix transcriptional regulator, partial [Prosthecobacter sp.]|nr:helix-turn-helix transcriptional regulator [Prosthecobacter sp.]